MASSDIVVSPVESKADLNAFIALPRRLYAGHKGYVAPLDLERREAFTPGKNPLFEHVEAAEFAAAHRLAGGMVVFALVVLVTLSLANRPPRDDRAEPGAAR